MEGGLANGLLALQCSRDTIHSLQAQSSNWHAQVRSPLGTGNVSVIEEEVVLYGPHGFGHATDVSLPCCRPSQQRGNGQPLFGGMRSPAATGSRRNRRSTPRDSGGTVYQSVDEFESPDEYESDPSDMSDDDNDQVTSGWHGNGAGASAAMAAFPRPGHSKADTQLPQKFESKLHLGTGQGRGTGSPAVPGEQPQHP